MIGMSCSATIFYGLCPEQDGDEPIWDTSGFDDDYLHDWEKALDRVLELKQIDWTAENSIEQYRARNAARDALGVEIISHGYCDYPYYAVAIIASEIRVHQGDPVELTARSSEPDWNENLLKFCELMGIKTEGLKAA